MFSRQSGQQSGAVGIVPVIAFFGINQRIHSAANLRRLTHPAEIGNHCLLVGDGHIGALHAQRKHAPQRIAHLIRRNGKSQIYAINAALLQKNILHKGRQRMPHRIAQQAK